MDALTSPPDLAAAWRRATETESMAAIAELEGRSLPFEGILRARRARFESRWVEIAPLLEEATARTRPEDTWAYALAIERALEAHDRWHLEEAARLLEEAEALAANAPPCDRLRGQLIGTHVAFGRGDWAAWEAYSDRATATVLPTPTGFQHWSAAMLERGGRELEFGDPRLAYEAFHRLLETPPPADVTPRPVYMAFARFGLAAACAREDRDDEALRWLVEAEALALPPGADVGDEGALAAFAATALERLGRSDAADIRYEAAVDAVFARARLDEPNAVWVDLVLARAARRRGQLERARAHYVRATRRAGQGALLETAAAMAWSLMELAVGTLERIPAWPATQLPERFSALYAGQALVEGLRGHRQGDPAAVAAWRRAARHPARVIDRLAEFPELVDEAAEAFLAAEEAEAAHAVKAFAARLERASGPGYGLSGEVEIALLGPLAVRVNGQRVAHWPRRKARVALAALALHPRGLDYDAFAELLDDDKGLSPNALHVTIAALRRALEPGLAQGAPSRYVLYRDGRYVMDWKWIMPLDVARFKAAVVEARQLGAASPAAAAGAYERALVLYRGDLLDDMPYFAAERRALGELAVEALAWLAERCRVHGNQQEGERLRARAAAIGHVLELELPPGPEGGRAPR